MSKSSADLNDLRIARDTAIEQHDELGAAKAQLAIYDGYMARLAESDDWDGTFCRDQLPDGAYLQDLVVSMESALRHLIAFVEKSQP